MTSIFELFTDEIIIARIKNKLPKLFHIADLESQRAGKIGMEVGSIKGRLYYFPLEVQLEIFESIGRDNYIKLPSLGTNPRGVEITSKALQALVTHNNSYKIEIDWQKEDLKFNSFKRWVDLWAQD